MKLLRTPQLALLTIAIAACSSNSDRTIDPTATYDVYGERFESATAVPAPAVVAEPDAFVGRTVIIEGMAERSCADGGCWAKMEGGIDVFADPAELGVPEDVSGRRIIVTGTLQQRDAAPQTPAEAGDALSTPDTRVPATTDTLGSKADSTFTLRATGIMVEKIRS